MRLIVIHLFAAIVVASCPGLAVAKPLPLPSPSPDPTCTGDPNGAAFVADKVRFLPVDGFVFSANGGGHGTFYSGPTVGSAVDPSSSYATVFAAAFKAAPPFLQQELCNNLNYVFVDQGNQGDVIGWAFWEVSGQDNGAGRWIAIPDEFFQAGPARTTPITNAPLHVIETVILHQLLLPPTSITPLPTNTPPVYSVVPTSHDTQAYGLLSLMAHEMGHILYYEKCEQPPVPSRSQSLCNTVLTGWHDRGVRPPIHKFKTGFDDSSPSSGPPSHVPGEPSLKEVIDDFQLHSNDPKKLRWIYGLSPNGNIFWADLFAAVAADEDFVETYKIWVLKNAGITGLKLQFTANPQDSVDIISTNLANNSVLSQKVNAVSGLLP
jgi:hypothetical protein